MTIMPQTHKQVKTLDHFPAFSWELNADAECIRVNAYWRKHTGRNAAGFSEVVHAEDLEKLKNKITGLRRNESSEPFQWECRQLDTKGMYRYALYQIQRQEHPNGRCTFLGFGLDTHTQKEQELVYQQDQGFMRSILNTVMVGVVKVNLEGVIIFANEAAQRILELEISQITGRFFHSYEWKQIDLNGDPFPPEKLPLAIALGEERSVENIQHGIAYRGIRKWLTVNATPVYHMETGKIKGAVASFSDITELIESEIEVRRNVQELNNFRKALDRSAIISITDRKGRIIEANETFCKTSGYTRQELIGKDHSIINSGYHPKEYFQSLWRTIARGKPWRGETKNKRKDGTFYWVDTVISPLYDENGKIDRYLSVRYEVTQRKENEEKLKDLALVAQETDNMVVITDSSERIEWVNKSFTEVTGYTFEEVAGEKPGHILQGEKTDPKTVQAIRQAFDKGEGIETELINYRKNGEAYWTLINVQPVFDESGTLIKYVSIQSDITEQRFAEQQLLQQNDELKKTNSELDNFVYRVSHDLRAPIASSLGLIELSIQIDDIPQLREYLKMQRKSLNKLDNFINDILNYSRNSRIEVAQKPIDWEELLEDVKLGLINESHKHIRVKQEIEAEGTFYSDSMRISIIVNNLLSNALKFVRPYEPDPEVIIRVKSQDSGAEIIIEDNGMGIPEASQSRVFEMFYRATDVNYGTGLGLYIVKESIDRLNGKVSLASEQNKGTRFTIWLPNLTAEKEAE